MSYISYLFPDFLPLFAPGRTSRELPLARWRNRLSLDLLQNGPGQLHLRKSSLCGTLDPILGQNQDTALHGRARCEMNDLAMMLHDFPAYRL
jgi:hypothetical protein